MAIPTFVYRALLALGLLALIAGCTTPPANPIVAPPPVHDGDPLDVNSDHITVAPSGRWIVTSDWYISAERTVTIDPDVVIMFDGLWWVDVEGTLIAEGDAGHPITFTSARLDYDLGDWRGLKLRNATTDPDRISRLKYCVFTYGAYFDDDTLTDRGKDAQNYRGMLSIRNSSPIIERCLVYKNQNNAVFITHDTDSIPAPMPMPDIRYNILTKNDGAAVRTGPDVALAQLTIQYNTVGDNSIPAFLFYETDSTYGRKDTVNLNLDSTDIHFNLDVMPEMADPENGDYTLTSCSPAIDSGPAGSEDGEPDHTRIDAGPIPYIQVPGELRGVWSGSLDPSVTYRMSCHVRVPQQATLVIPAGTRIEATGEYNLEVYGRLDVQGTPEDSVEMCACLASDGVRWGGLRFFNLDSVSAPSVIRHAVFKDFNQVDVFRKGVTFDNVTFNGGYFYGVGVQTNSVEPFDSVSFRNCTFEHCGSYGIQANYSAVTIRNTLIESGQGRGISLTAVGTGVEITNTIVRACSTSGIYMQNQSSPLIVNNVITGNSYHGIHLSDNCRPVIMNNIVFANRRYGIEVELSSAPQMSYNNLADNGLSNFHSESTPAAPCNDCISLNPLFAGDGNLHLGAGSPSVDTGNPDPQYNDVDGSRNDQGAYGGPNGFEVGAAGFYRSNQRVVTR